jgi:hypothetical protein
VQRAVAAYLGTQGGLEGNERAATSRQWPRTSTTVSSTFQTQTRYRYGPNAVSPGHYSRWLTKCSVR